MAYCQSDDPSNVPYSVCYEWFMLADDENSWVPADFFLGGGEGQSNKPLPPVPKKPQSGYGGSNYGGSNGSGHRYQNTPNDQYGQNFEHHQNFQNAQHDQYGQNFGNQQNFHNQPNGQYGQNFG